MELHVVYASDDNYAPYMGISMYSLLKNNSNCFDKIHVYVLDNGIGTKNHARLEKQAAAFDNVELVVHAISQEIQAIRPKYETGWSNSIFGRYFIDDIVKEGVDKLLYLDCDTIVNRSLKELFALDISDYYAAGVIDGLSQAQMEYLQLDAGGTYVNSGVLLINVNRWKREGIGKKLIEYVNSFDRRLIYPDQDAFNAVCGQSLLRLPLKYNCFQTMDFDYIDTYVEKDNPPYSYEEILEAMADDCAGTVIFHFTGGKPWNKSESCPRFERLFTQYAKQSCWSHIRPKFRNLSMAFEYYHLKAVMNMYELARRMLGDRFYNSIKQKFKGE